IRASELQTKLLGIAAPPPPKPAEPTATEGAPAEGAAPAVPADTGPTLTIEERAKLSRLQGDLVWLVREGYVTEFIDGRLFAPPPMVEARKKEIESEENDPENFPEAPADQKPTTPAAAENESTSDAGENPATSAAPESVPPTDATPAPESSAPDAPAPSS